MSRLFSLKPRFYDMHPGIRRLRCLAFALPLLLSGLCHGQSAQSGDQPITFAQALYQASERPAPLTAYTGSAASQASGEPPLQMGARQDREGRTDDRQRPSPPVPPFRSAWKRGVAELALEGYTAVIIQCQKRKSPAATVALMRSDSPQAHCFRF